MNRPPIDLRLKTVTTKIAPSAWDRAQALKELYGVRLSDIVSACLLFMPEEELGALLARQKSAVDGLPKPIRGMLRNIDKLTDDEKAFLKEILSEK